ncbi:MAG: pilus assembly protein CpaE [Chloroflexota bacterium]|nr:pilus assembly protein CpaE [Chloroflexota bacterium]
MSDTIRVLVVDDIAETRDHISKLLSFETDMDVVGLAASGAEALDIAKQLQPDVVLMDINMPGMDGIATTELLASRAPKAAIVMMSVQGEADYLRRSMLAGAREFLVKPFSSDELCDSIRQVYSRERDKHNRAVPASSGIIPVQPSGERQPGKIISVFSPKGGVGRTTIAVNLAVAMAAELHRSVALMDASFQFGDVGVLLNMNPKNKSISDVLADVANGDVDAVDSTLIGHTTGIHVLLAPPSPEMAELITPDHVRKIVKRLSDTHELVVVDCWPLFQDPTLGLLDQSDLILVLLTLEITNIKNIRLFLGLAEQLGYSDKLRLVLNRADSAYGIRVSDIEHSIGRKVDHTVVSDGRTVVYALNRGVPFVWSNKQAQVSQDILGIARAVAGDAEVALAPEKTAQKRSLFARR